MNRRRGLEITALIVAYFAGWYSAKLVKVWSRLVLDPKINPVPVGALGLTLVISVVFFRTFERQKYADKLRKDALLDRLKSSRDSLASLEEMCETTTLEYDRVVSTIRKFRREFRVLVTFAQTVSAPIAEAKRDQFNAGAGTVHRLLTDTPPRADPNQPDPDSPLVKGENSLVMSRNRQVEVSNEIGRVKNALDAIETDIILEV